jgi:catechol 2,3-dioxygenase-like lactoylglutathione lyase family enzyme
MFFGTALCVLMVAACAATDSGETIEMPQGRPDIQGLNAFYYYEDVERAWVFYRDVLGFETVSDFGFAKIMQVAPASYLTLVDADRGMHSTDEPKSVTLAIVTETVEEWYAYLVSEGVELRSELTLREGSAHDGFVAVDPEGYLLEFEWFNEHPENEQLSPRLERTEGLRPTAGSRPPELTVHATVLWLYYDELAPIEAFYEGLFDVDLLVDQGWAKVYTASATGYIGLVDGSRGLHQATPEKAVTVSFITSDAEGWMARASELGVPLRSEEMGNESDRVQTFVGFDPGGYFLEWDTFLERPGNETLLERLLNDPFAGR